MIERQQINMTEAKSNRRIMREQSILIMRSDCPEAFRMETTVSSLSELSNSISANESGSKEPQSQSQSTKRAVVLCFGGQNGRVIALNQEVYESVVILRMHLDHCDAVRQLLGVKSLYPQIFSEDSIEDLVLLHYMLFAPQYSWAKTWIDCGLQVEAMIGHSFGLLAALCVSESITLENAINILRRVLIGVTILVTTIRKARPYSSPMHTCHRYDKPIRW